MKNWKKLISAGLALGLVLTSVPQSTSVVYAQENGTLQNVTFEQEQEAVQNAPITVQKVNGLSKDFVNGVDVSSYLSLVESGAKYYDEKGDETDLFDLLENAGVNYVRLRVWNDRSVLCRTGGCDDVSADRKLRNYTGYGIRQTVAGRIYCKRAFTYAEQFPLSGKHSGFPDKA